MNYHMIRTDDMLNGDGLRVIIFLSGCEHHCHNCHNPETWDVNSGRTFTPEAAKEIILELGKDHISGITLSGGDPLHNENLEDVYKLLKEIRETYPSKSIWIYTGYEWEQITKLVKGISPEAMKINKANNLRNEIIKLCDVIVDGKYVEALADVNFPWCGSTNQRVIDIKKTLSEGHIMLFNK